MPNRWIALKCESCGNPLEPLADMQGIVHVDSAEVVQKLTEAMEKTNWVETRFSRIPITGGDMHVEIIKSPFADLLRCTYCKMLYERESEGD